MRNLPLPCVAALLATVVLTPLVAPAQAAGFINNGQQWLALTPDEKLSYVRGLNDSANFVFTDDSLDAAIVKLSRTKCLIEKKVTTAILADMLTTAYTKDAAQYAKLPPLVVFMAKLGNFCRDVISRERQGFGLPPGP